MTNHSTSRHQTRLPTSPSQQSLSRLDRRADSVSMGCKSIPEKSKNRATVSRESYRASAGKSLRFGGVVTVEDFLHPRSRTEVAFTIYPRIQI
jgi:hypothetical protein